MKNAATAMDKLVSITINDPHYYHPDAINDKGSQFMKYGKYHNQTLEFGIRKTSFSENIYCKTPGSKIYKPVMFCWLTGGYDENGIQKLAVISYNHNSENICSFYLHEIISLLEQLESVKELNSWQSQLTA